MIQKFFWFLVIFSAISYVGIGVLLYMFQRTLMYHPTPVVHHTCQERVFINEGESIKVITLNEGNSNALIYFGGNGEAVAYNCEIFQKEFSQYTLYLVNYRGYGGSTGKPTEEALYSDALKIYDQIKSDHAHVSLIGRSLGSGIATYLASQRDIDKIALVTPFDSIEKLAQEKYPMYPMSFFLKDKYDSFKYLAQVKSREVLILVAQKDRVIPPPHSFSLAKSVSEDFLHLEVIENRGHNSISNDERYYDILKTFFDGIK